MLLDGRYTDLYEFFEDIADALNFQQRMAMTAGLSRVRPRLFHFSDSVILYSRLGDHADVNHFAFRLVIESCLAVLVTGLRKRIPIRGAIASGDLFVGDAETLVKKTHRYGLAFEFPWKGSEPVPSPTDWETDPCFVSIPVHMGPALTDAYLLQESCNAVGVFLKEELLSFVPEVLARTVYSEIVAKRVLDGRPLQALNWRYPFRNHADGLNEIVEFARTQTNHADARVAAKWQNFLQI